MLVDIIAANRSDIMRITSVLDTIQQEQLKGTRLGYRFIYTGKDIAINLEKELFTQLKISRPNIYLNVDEQTIASKASAAMLRYEKVLSSNKPDFVLITGKTPEALSCAYIARVFGGIKIGVINAGVRSGDKENESEINRVLIDSISDSFFTCSHIANEALRQSGVVNEKLFLVGNPLADTVLKSKPHFTKPIFEPHTSLEEKKYYVVALNKQHNTNDPAQLKNLILSILKYADHCKVVFLSNSDTDKKIASLGIQAHNLLIVNKISYLQLGWLIQHAKVVITDSNGIQEQCTILGTMTLTLNNTSESLETVESGYNRLSVGDFEKDIGDLLKRDLNKRNTPYLWDGKASEKIIAVLKKM